MNFLMLVGLACENEDFRLALKTKGIAALRDSGLPFLLSENEVENVTGYLNNDALYNAFGAVGGILCPIRPCPKYNTPSQIPHS